MSTTTGVVERLVTEVDGQRMVFCNNAAVAGNGDIWFSDSSTVYPIEQWKADFVEHTETGRLLCRRADGSVEVHLDGLAFANGVALAADESYVCVAETGRRTVVRLWLTGERAGTTDLLADELPGYPDNIARGSDGLIWVTIASPGGPARRAAARTRAAVGAQGRPPGSRSAAARSRSGPSGCRRSTTPGAWCTTSTPTPTSSTWSPACVSTTGEVWLGSLHEPALAVLGLSGRRLDHLDSGAHRREPQEGAQPMGHLEHITGPQDLRGLDDRALDRAGLGDPRRADPHLLPRAAATSAPTSAWSS